MSKTKILVLVEGERREPKLFNCLFNVYDPEAIVEIVPYNTNIYVLYKELFADGEEEQKDLFMLLRSREKDKAKKKIFDERFNEVILIFDYDPHDSQYSAEKLRKLMKYFNNSTTNGRLFINYPMVESLFHLSAWDESQDKFNNRYVLKADIPNYKTIVDKENCGNDIRKLTRVNFNILIKLNLLKILFLLNDSISGKLLCDANKLYNILEIECKTLEEQEKVYVLNTCILYFYEYKTLLFNFSDIGGEL